MKIFLFCLAGLLATPIDAKTVTTTWYGAKFEGRKMASGLRFRANQRIIAHRSLPFGTRLKVTYKNHTVIGIVLDRGPYTRRASLDLSRSLAYKLGIKHKGTARVKIQVLDRIPKKYWRYHLQ